MIGALEQAYASAVQTPVLTVRLVSPGLTGGSIAFAQSYRDLTATLEDGVTSVVFEASGAAIDWPKAGVEGAEDIGVRLENVSQRARHEIKAAKAYYRQTGHSVRMELRQYLPSDLSAPVGGIYKALVTDTQVDRNVAQIKGAFHLMIDMVYPRRRYYAAKYPGLEYA
ncbi:DUF1833 family protein [Spongiibacter tropicus]|uniref:DUF1833 family protein n=1 Tax=Spongiibacter tropicus TaxID=454602 RepID=UPI0003B38F87|nr:DUF1833 family protein [Spongiibacter tropicus]